MRSPPRIKHVNLGRTMPVIIALAVAVYWGAKLISDRGWLAEPHAKLLGSFCAAALAAVFVLLIRLGRFPWFESHNGPHPLIVWLERTFPFLRDPRNK